MHQTLEQQFHEQMLETYRQAAAQGYHATYFLRMVQERGGVQAARDLLDAPSTSDGFTRLWELGRLDIAVEAIVLRPEFQPLFTSEQLAIARRRLRDVGYEGSKE